MHLVHLVRVFLAVWLFVGIATVLTGLRWTRKISAEMLKDEEP